MRSDAWYLAKNVEHVADVGFRVARTLDKREQVSDVTSAALSKLSEGHVYNESTVRRGGDLASKHLKTGMRLKDCPECPDMVVIPPGKFFLQRQFGKDSDPIVVTIDKPFAIGVYDVTRAEYGSFVRATHRQDGEGCQVTESGFFWIKKQDATWDHPGFAQTMRDPVVCVSWNDAQAYVQWLNIKLAAQKGRSESATRGHYRLPTGEEWEYAARGGTITISQEFYWGAAVSHEYANYGLDLCGHCGGKIEGRDHWLYTSPVGSFPPNPFGLFDSYGNVYQFTDDCFHAEAKDIPIDGSVWASGGDCRFRLARGGAYNDSGVGNYMNPFLPATRNNANGFRVVKTLD
jgi:formylglycine-generating enzyme required for sulfatase activity